MDQTPDHRVSDPDHCSSVLCFPFGYGFTLTIAVTDALQRTAPRDRISLMSIQSAINCLDENIRLYGNPRVDPEKYNLYNGLSEMARAIQRLDNEVEVIKNTVNGILHEVRRV